MDVLLAQPRGCCAGVARAIEIVERALDRYGSPVYVYHEIVHNGHVVEDLAARGAVFVDEIGRIPAGAVTVFSAHGVSHAVVAEAQARGLRVVDATCPLVTKVHVQAQRYSKRGHTLEDVAALPMPRDAPVAYVTQTTLSLDDTRELIEALEARYPGIAGPGLDDICYATLNRQRSTRAMARQVDLVLVVGARNSSNSNRLREVALQQGVPAYLVQTAAAPRRFPTAAPRRAAAPPRRTRRSCASRPARTRRPAHRPAAASP